MTASGALVLITTSFPIAGDGSEAAGGFVDDFAAELARHLPVRVVAPGTETRRETWREGMEVFRYAAPERPLSTLKPWVPKDMLLIRDVLRAGRKAAIEATRAGPTIHILALWALPSGYWARCASKHGAIPYSVWTLGSDIWSLGRMPVVRSYLRRVLAGARYRYADGMKLREDTARIARKPTEFLPSCRHTNLGRPVPPRSSPPYRLAFLGRWHQNKGIDLLLEALRLMDKWAWKRIERIDIYGGGPLTDLVQNEVSTLRQAGHPVEIHGFAPKQEAEEAIANIDFLIIPSRIESIPVVYSDAIKLGTPVISTPVGDLEELIGHQRTGVVAASTEPRDIAAAISTALHMQPSLFTSDLRRAAQQFDPKKVARRVAQDLLDPVT
jgi:Glycosyltransferase